MKRLLIVGLWLSLASASSAEVKELSIIYTHAKEELAKILLDFSTKNGVKLRSAFYTQDELKTNLLKLMELNAGPDAVIIPSDHLGLYNYVRYSNIDRGVFKANLSERVWESSKSDGVTYGLPIFQGNHLMLYYNRSLVDKPAKDWDMLMTQQAALQARGLEAIAWSYEEPFWFLPFLGAYGGWPVIDGVVKLDTPAMASALRFYKGLRKKEVPYPNCSYECTVFLFKAEQIAYTINGAWVGKELSLALGDKLGVSAIPMAEGNKIISTFSSHVLAFPGEGLEGDHRDILIALGNHLLSTEVQKQLWENFNAIPVDIDAYEFAKKDSEGYLHDTIRLMSETRSLPSDQAMTFVWDAIGKGFIRHEEGAFGGEAAAKFMQKLAERHIRNANRHILQDQQQSEAEQ